VRLRSTSPNVATARRGLNWTATATHSRPNPV
jgi:hypothetical protein